MPRVTDLSYVRSVLDRDRSWSAYAIGDLSPELVSDCAWYAPADSAPALLLLYRGFDPPILFAMGDGAHLSPLFREIEAPTVSLHVRSEAITAMAPSYRVVKLCEVTRMAVDPASFQPAVGGDVVGLTESDVDAAMALYEDGWRHDEGPTFFQSSMLRQGTFRGIREGLDLVAIAGTHLFSPELGVCAIGNVYTRRDRRRRGLGGRVTSAVVQHAIAMNVATIVLNVGSGNLVAQRVYEQLGFRWYCDFLEGHAVREG
jgi:ribosomal protein S18 acetylase RimI-like enzyme